MDDDRQRLLVGDTVDLIQTRIGDVELLPVGVQLEPPSAGGKSFSDECERAVRRIDPHERDEPARVLLCQCNGSKVRLLVALRLFEREDGSARVGELERPQQLVARDRKATGTFTPTCV
jgi:hypothetical protein